MTCRSHLPLIMELSSQSGLKSFQKTHGSPKLVPGCSFSIQLSPIPQEYKELKGNGPFTIFVPHADLMTNLSQVHSCGEISTLVVGTTWAETTTRGFPFPSRFHLGRAG